MIDMQTMTDNILSVFDRADNDSFNEGMHWYNTVNALCWELDFINYRRAAGVIAVLSPMLSWDKNIEYARMVYAYESRIPCLQSNALKAMAIRDGWEPLDHLGGVKVNSFYSNIINPYSGDSVTIDTHAACIAVNDFTYRYKSSAGRYRLFSDAYRNAADEIGILPMQIQAITWIEWRKEHQYKKKG